MSEFWQALFVQLLNHTPDLALLSVLAILDFLLFNIVIAIASAELCEFENHKHSVSTKYSIMAIPPTLQLYSAISVSTSWKPSNGTPKFYLWSFVWFIEEKDETQLRYFASSASSYRSTSSILPTDWVWCKTVTLDEKYLSLYRKVAENIFQYDLLQSHPID